MYEPTDFQALILWSLVTSGGEGFAKDQLMSINKRDRTELVTAGYLEVDRRQHTVTGRLAIYLTVADKGWVWLEQHIDRPIQTRSNRGALVLAQLLRCVGTHLQRQQLSLAEFIAPPSDPQPLGTAPAPNPTDLTQRIEQAALQLGNGQYNQPLRIADLRQHLADVPRAQLDAALLQLEQCSRLRLARQDNPQQIGPQDESAKIVISSVGERHLIYWEQ